MNLGAKSAGSLRKPLVSMGLALPLNPENWPPKSIDLAVTASARTCPAAAATDTTTGPGDASIAGLAFSPA